VLQRVAACCSVLQRVAVCCSVLQRVAACCSVLQRVAACCSVLQCDCLFTVDEKVSFCVSCVLCVFSVSSLCLLCVFLCIRMPMQMFFRLYLFYFVGCVRACVRVYAYVCVRVCACVCVMVCVCVSPPCVSAFLRLVSDVRVFSLDTNGGKFQKDVCVL